MKRRFYLVPAAISLVCAQASFANDIENAITKYGGKIGIKGSAANLINSQIHNVTSSGAASTAGTAGAAAGGPTTSAASSATTTNTSKTSSFKNALQQVFSKSDSAAPVTNNPAATLNSLSSGTGNLGQPAAVVPGVAAPHKQSVKAKIGKEIWRQAKRYESKHPNKLMHTGVNSLSKVVGQP